MLVIFMSSASDDASQLFSQHEHALEKAYEICPECGSELHIKQGKKGAFLGCSNYPTCVYTRPLHEQAKVEQKILEGSSCPECGSLLAVKQGRYGLFIGCTNYPQCQHIEHQQQQHELDVTCPKCKKGKLQEKQSRFGKTFYSCDHYPHCKFVVNYRPVAKTCEQCHFALMVERQLADGLYHQCANKKCNHKQKVE